MSIMVLAGINLSLLGIVVFAVFLVTKRQDDALKQGAAVLDMLTKLEHNGRE